MTTPSDRERDLARGVRDGLLQFMWPEPPSCDEIEAVDRGIAQALADYGAERERAFALALAESSGTRGSLDAVHKILMHRTEGRRIALEGVLVEIDSRRGEDDMRAYAGHKRRQTVASVRAWVQQRLEEARKT